MQSQVAIAVVLLALLAAPPRLAFGRGGAGSSSGSHSSSGGKSVHVSGYFRKDGTYVAPYDRAAPGSGGGSARTTARISASSQPRTTARGQDDDGAGARTAAAIQPRTMARAPNDSAATAPVNGNTAERMQDDEDGVAREAGAFQPGMTARGLRAEANDPAAGVDDALSIERARRIKAEEEAANLRKQLEAKRVADAQQADLDKAEKLARGMLVAAKTLIRDGKEQQGVKMLKSLIERYPKSKAATEARKMPGVPLGM